ncbi:hypothetical protein [Proteus mirabilis]|nr:hypothetical protein [Proteus mirabilis]MDH7533388.1 hypothetical protein [Proteus mirabilis]MDM3629790.1 hypothetical protein [Proteus mirabilis]MDM3640576.1 hypothetical protein [Proteus mirabilis]MDM3709162.1 hypothetical protein [Proteus mirabilis]MDM3782413.1 hypothetical protein [Proteus mirabilis]
MSRKSIGINNDRYLKIERAAVDITAKGRYHSQNWKDHKMV